MVNIDELEEEKNKAIPADVASWIAAPTRSIYNIMARIGYKVVDLLSEMTNTNNKIVDLKADVDVLQATIDCDKIRAELLILHKKLFLITPKDYALDSRHTIKFATYGRHCACSHEEGETKPTLRIKTRGWVTPVHCKDKDMIKVTYEKVTDADQLKGMIGNYRAAKLNVYRLQFNGGELTDTSKWSTLGIHEVGDTTYRELKKKLGVQILSNGVPVSEWIPFYVNRTAHEDDSSHDYAMININLGSTVAPNSDGNLSSGNVD